MAKTIEKGAFYITVDVPNSSLNKACVAKIEIYVPEKGSHVIIPDVLLQNCKTKLRGLIVNELSKDFGRLPFGDNDKREYYGRVTFRDKSVLPFPSVVFLIQY